MVEDFILEPPEYLARCRRSKRLAPRSPRIVCLTVKESSKDQLFRRALAGCIPRPEGPTTESILRRLRQLDPEVSQHFRVKAKDRIKAPLRLLRECTEDTSYGDPQGFESYIALSYCWHSSVWRPVSGLEIHNDPIFPGWHWPISRRMFRALLDMRHSTNEGIWIDAISINQADLDEKMSVIEAMNVIYSSARLVVIVLEDVRISDHDADIVRACVTKGQWASNFRSATDQYIPPEGHMRPLATALIQILSARWFGRAFCSQEMQLANESIFLVPTSTGYLELYRYALEWLHYITREYAQQNEDLFNQISDVSMSYDILTRAGDNREQSDLHYSLSLPYMSIFRDLLLLGCSNIRDKLSIALNVLSLNLAYHGEVSDMNRCRWVLAMLALAAGDATVLSNQGDVIESGSMSSNMLFLQWPGDHDSISMLPEVHPRLLDDAQLIKVKDGEFCVDMLIFKKGHAPLRPTCDSSTKASLFLNACMLEHARALQSLNPIWTQLESATISTELNGYLCYCRDILASSLDCGIQWMASVMWQASVGPFLLSEAQINTVKEFWDAVCTHLLSASTFDRLTGQILQSIRHSFLAYIAFVFSRTPDSFLDTCNIARLVTGTSQQSGITPLVDASGLTLAVPAALAGPNYCTYVLLEVTSSHQSSG